MSYIVNSWIFIKQKQQSDGKVDRESFKKVAWKSKRGKVFVKTAFLVSKASFTYK